MHAVGILLCILCFIPAVIFDEFGGHFWDNFSGAMLFVFVGAGVFLIVYSRAIKSTYSKLLNINDKTEFEPWEEKPWEEKRMEKYPNKTIRTVMSAYWSVVTCIYLCVSFLTFKWHMTWLIWPIAAAVNTVIIAICKVNEDKDEKSKTEKDLYKAE